MDRIKGIRQKTNGGVYSQLVPFGTDAILVDFLSGLDLQEELKIGGKHSTTITEESDSQTSIIEKYYNDANPAIVTYTLQVTITQTNSTTTTIVMNLYEGDQTTTILHSKTITITQNIINQKVTTSIQEVL